MISFATSRRGLICDPRDQDSLPGTEPYSQFPGEILPCGPPKRRRAHRNGSTLRHREDGAGRCDAVQRMRSERDQRRLRFGGERARDEDRSAERPA